MMRLSLDDIAEHLEQWHKYTNYGMALCEFHDDQNPSMRVTQYGYKCLACGARGSLEKLYEKVSGRVIIGKRIYNPSASIWKIWLGNFGSIPNIARIAHLQLRNNPDLAHYLIERRIDSEIKNGMMGYLDGYYVFPIKNEYEEIQGIVARASPTIETKSNRYTVSTDCPVKLYVPFWRRILKADELYVCYGIMDSWTLNLAGYDGLTGISGQELSAINLERFRKRIYIIPDKNEEKNALELQCKLGWRGCPLFLDWPDGTKDLNGIHQEYGLDTVSELIEKSKEKYKYG